MVMLVISYKNKTGIHMKANRFVKHGDIQIDKFASV